jgi:hypothetical protein
MPRIGQPFLAQAGSFAHSILAPMRRAADTFAHESDYSTLKQRIMPALGVARASVPAIDQAFKTSVDGLPSLDVLTSGAERIESAIRAGLTSLERATRGPSGATAPSSFKANPQLRLMPGWRSARSLPRPYAPVPRVVLYHRRLGPHVQRGSKGSQLTCSARGVWPLSHHLVPQRSHR